MALGDFCIDAPPVQLCKAWMRQDERDLGNVRFSAAHEGEADMKSWLIGRDL
jgi:hypothetical protein